LLLGLIICLSCQENHKDFQVEDSNMNDYALYDEKGNFHRFSYYNNSKALVLFVQGNGCPMVRNALNDFNKIMEEYKESGFTFFMINSNLQDSRTKIEKEAKDFNFKIPVLCDSSQIVADALDITITAQIIILHPTTRQILFSGPINDRVGYESQKNNISNNYLRDALDAINNNIDIKKNTVATKGCKVT
jgi:peroxiredoxin